MEITWIEYSRAEPLTAEIVALAQKELGVHFPDDFVELMMKYQGMEAHPTPCLVHSNRSLGSLMHFTRTSRGEDGTIQAYCRRLWRNEYPKDLIPFSARGQAHFALDFRESATHPSVVYVFPESDEEPWVSVYIAYSITHFLSLLRPNEHFYNVSHDLYACDGCDFETRVQGPVEPKYFYSAEVRGFHRLRVNYVFSWCHTCEDIRPVEDFHTDSAHYEQMVPLATEKLEQELQQGEFSMSSLLKYRKLFENTEFKPRCLCCFSDFEKQKGIVSPSIAIHSCGGQIRIKNLDFMEVESEALRVDYPWDL